MPGISVSKICVPFGGGGIDWSSYWATRTPSALVLTALSPTSIRAAWTNAGLGFDGHSVEISTDGIAFTEVDTVLIGTNTLDITGLDSGTLYYVRVRAYKVVLPSTQYSPYCDIVSEETIYLPTDIANLYIWNDAAQLTGLADNASVTSFLDFSGNNRHLATGTNKPIYKTDILNGRPSVRFDGVNDILQCTGLSITNPHTNFLVIKRLTGTDLRYPVAYNSGNIVFYSNTRITINSGATLSHDTDALLNRPVIISAVYNGVSGLIAVNGGTPTTGNTGTKTGDRVCMGDVNTGGYPINADFFDHAVYLGALDAATRRRIEKYFSWKYAVELEPI